MVVEVVAAVVAVVVELELELELSTDPAGETVTVACGRDTLTDPSLLTVTCRPSGSGCTVGSPAIGS